MAGGGGRRGGGFFEIRGAGRARGERGGAKIGSSQHSEKMRFSVMFSDARRAGIEIESGGLNKL
jgi:hypothetical protein